MIKNLITLTIKNTRLTSSRNVYLFAKQKSDKPQKGGDKPEKGGRKQQSNVIQFVDKVPPKQIMRDYLKTFQDALSPIQLQTMNEKFTDLSEQQKNMLSAFADQILDLKTPSFLQFNRYGGLGTSDSFYVTTHVPTDQQIQNSIKYLRKQ